MLNWLELKNFAAFPEAPRLKFAKHLDVIVGENGEPRFDCVFSGVLLPDPSHGGVS